MWCIKFKNGQNNLFRERKICGKIKGNSTFNRMLKAWLIPSGTDGIQKEAWGCQRNW